MIRQLLSYVLIASIIISAAIVSAHATASTLTNSEYLALEQENPLLAQADKNLNSAYSRAYTLVSDDGKRALRVAQRRWIKTRDVNAEAAGTVGTAAFVASLIAQTQARAADLDRLASVAKQEHAENVFEPGSAPQSSMLASASATALSARQAQIGGTPNSAQPASAPAPKHIAPVARITSTPTAMPPLSTQNETPGKSVPSREVTNDDLAKRVAWGLFATIVIFGSVGAIRGIGGHIVVYINYTDAAISVLGFWGGLITSLALLVSANMFNAPYIGDAAPYVFIFVLGAALIMGVRSSIASNRSIGAAALSMAAKLLISIAFILYALVYLTSAPNRRQRENESDDAYALRIRREQDSHERTGVAMVLVSAATTYLVHKLTRDQRWVGLGNYLKE